MSDDTPLTPEDREAVRAMLREFRDVLPQIPVVEWRVDPPPAGAPDRGADVDAWLDWRAKEKAKRGGVWYRLAQIAKWSGHTIAQLKYKSSLRKPRGTTKTTTKGEKKFNE